MDQTTLNQFFVTRKSSFSLAVPPAKRIKLDVTKIEKTDGNNRGVQIKGNGKSKPKNANTRKGKKSRSTDNNYFGVKDLTSAKPIQKTNDTSITPKLKTCNKLKNDVGVFITVNSEPESNLSSGLVIKKGSVTPVKEMKCNQLDFNDEINDQAKTILFSRGSTILRAGFENNMLKSPSKASEILNSLSPQKNYDSYNRLTIIGSPRKMDLKSPTKLSEILNTLKSPAKALRNTEITESSNMLTPPKNIKATQPVGDRRERLKNKFKHLLKDEGTSSSGEIIETKKECVLQDQEEKVQEKAHQKFKNLSQKAIPSGFIFPQKFKILVEMFRCVDSILFLLEQRAEICTFEKLKKSVQSMCSRNFEQNHLAAMKTIYPVAFTFRQEKKLSSKSCQLTIEANFKECVTSNSSKITSHVLIMRRLKFETKLLDILKGHHQKFLQKINMNICQSEIHRWHPHFKVNEVPDIELSSLPQPPVIKCCTSAAELIMNTRGNLAPKVNNALCNAAKKSSLLGISVDTNVSKDTQTRGNLCDMKVNTNSRLTGVSSSILERIRQKEQKKMQLTMTRDPEKEEKLSKMQRLPEICRILKSYFISERKVAITLEDCIQKLIESFGTSINLERLEEHVRLLAELVPEWLTILSVRKFPFVKLAKGYDINKVIKTLNNLRTKESET